MVLIRSVFTTVVKESKKLQEALSGNIKMKLIFNFTTNFSNMIILYCDGSCIGNPGYGGWAVCLIENDIEFYLSPECPFTHVKLIFLFLLTLSYSFHKSRFAFLPHLPVAQFIHN